MTPLDRLRELEAKATPGPWVDGHRPDGDGLVNFSTHPTHSPEYRANLQLVEALRNLAPELIRLWEACEAWENDPLCLRDDPETDWNAALYFLNARSAEVMGVEE
jgi:hypothetical protein